MKRLSQTKLSEEALLSVQISTKHNTLKGKKDFISKLEIALKEASEAGYWLELLYRTQYIDENLYMDLSAKCKSIRAMLVASCKTAKENNK